MKNEFVHINWGACRDWDAVRQKMVFLGVVLYGNHCDVDGDSINIRRQLQRRGLKVIREQFHDSHGTRPLLRVSDQERAND
jgi:hypothetical protein